MCDLFGEWRAPLCMHSAVMPACADGPQPPADHAWVLLLLPLLAGLVGQWRLRRDNLQLRRQLAQAEAHHLKEVARLQHARDAAVKALGSKLQASRELRKEQFLEYAELWYKWDKIRIKPEPTQGILSRYLAQMAEQRASAKKSVIQT